MTNEVFKEASMRNELILCLDFDGVIHSYESGWQGADFIPDPPVEGAIEFIFDALRYFNVVIFSSRSHQEGGTRAMQNWLKYWAKKQLTDLEDANRIINEIVNNKDAWPVNKPAAFITIDDRAITFTGKWPHMDELTRFKPWNKKPRK